MVPANSNNLFPFLYFPYFIETIGSKIMLARSSSVEDGDVLPREVMMGEGNGVASVIMLTFIKMPGPHADFYKDARPPC